MVKIRFDSDYTEGAHPAILEMLVASNMEQTDPYGEDNYSLKAAALIKEKCNAPTADVHFLVGGTQTNLTLISAALRPHQGVIAAVSGHINVHETGAIEATGHKVLAVAGIDGKLTARLVEQTVDAHFNDSTHEHMVQPGMVYLSNPTELGTIYSLAELTAIHNVCRQKNLFLYLDGARLGYGLTAEGNDLDLPALTRLCDAFYIGGTKVGAMIGEALVIVNPSLKEDFRYLIKQRGAMAAKGRILGIQFLALFENDLYFTISAHANHLAAMIRDACMEAGYPFLTRTVTNQQFPILPDLVLEELGKKYEFSFWQKVDDSHSAVRFCTSWATKEENVLELVKDIKKTSHS